MTKNFEKTSFNNDSSDPLGDLLNVEIGPCSVVASEACKAAHNEFKNASKSANLYPIDTSPPTPIRFDYSYLHHKNLSFEGKGVSLAIARPYKSTEQLVKSKLGFILPKFETVKEYYDDPRLLAIFVNDMYLELATFAKRPGECNYVQIGTEIKDDNFTVTTLDDGATSRISIVEAIRALIDEHASKFKDSETKAVLQKLLDDEMSKREKEFAAAKEAHLARRCHEFAKAGSKRELHVLESGQSTAQKLMHISPLISSCQLESGHLVEFSFGLNAENSSDLQLLAITRGNLALPLASMSNDDGKVEFNQIDANHSVEKKQLVDGLVKMLNGGGYWSYSSPKELKYTLEKLNGIDAVISEHIGKKHILLFEKNSETSSQSSRIFTQEKLLEITTNIDKFLADPEHLSNPYPDSMPLKLAIFRYYERQDGQRKFLNQFGIKEKLKSTLGESTPEEEAVMSKIQRLSTMGNKFAGVLKDRKIGTVKGDTQFIVYIKNDGTGYELTTHFRWHAMEDRDYDYIDALSLTFDSKSSLFDRSKSRFDYSERARIIYEVLSALEPVHA
jgi:hypothetical protein